MDIKEKFENLCTSYGLNISSNPDYILNASYVLNLLLELSQNEILNIDEEIIFLLRKKLGILDENSLSNDKLIMGQEKENLLLEKGILQIIEVIKRKRHNDDISRMSALPYDSPYRNFELSFLPFSPKVIFYLNNYRIYTLYDLLSYNSLDFKRMGMSDFIINGIYELVHSLGYRFADEMEPYEVKGIVENSSLDMQLNSSISWVFLRENAIIDTIYGKYKKNIVTIKDIAANCEKVSDTLFELCFRVGINLNFLYLYLNGQKDTPSPLDYSSKSDNYIHEDNGVTLSSGFENRTTNGALVFDKNGKIKYVPFEEYLEKYLNDKLGFRKK